MKNVTMVLLAVSCILALAFGVYAAPTASKLAAVPDGYGGFVTVQGAAPNGLLSSTHTSSYTHDMTGKTWWGAFCAAECKGRLMPTSAKGAYPQFTIPAGAWYGEVVNSSLAGKTLTQPTPFVNISGAHEWKAQ